MRGVCCRVQCMLAHDAPHFRRIRWGRFRRTYDASAPAVGVDGDWNVCRTHWTFTTARVQTQQIK
jgi:hypothetical protein